MPPTSAKEKGRALLGTWFDEGWLFFLPYALLYAVFDAFQLRLVPLHGTFLALHVVTLVALVAHLARRGRPAPSSCIFWAVLFLLFLLPQAYLEYPADPWEHFRRIFAWSSFDHTQEHYYRNKMGYYWVWTLLSWASPSQQAPALSLIAALGQLLLAFQFLSLARRLGVPERWAKLQVIATILLFGTSLFPFYRYYALSTTPIAYAGYLRLLILALDVADGHRRALWRLPPLVFLIFWNHPQELVLALVAAIALTIGIVLERRPSWRRPFFAKALLVLTAGAAVGKVLRSHPELLDALVRPVLAALHPAARRSVSFDRALLQLTGWGATRFFDAKRQYLQTLGVPGLLGIAAAIALRHRWPIVTALTLTPIFFLNFPPFVLPMVRLTPPEDLYRLLYAFPTSFALVLALREWLARPRPVPRTEHRQLALALGALVLLAIPYGSLWRGRLALLLYRPPAEARLAPATSAAMVFHDRNLRPPWCLRYGDGATEFAFATHFAIRLEREGVRGGIAEPGPIENGTSAELDRWLRKHSACAFVVRNVDGRPEPDSSWVGRSSGHWPADYLAQIWHHDERLAPVAEGLLALGWRRKPLTAAYWWYELPAEAHRSFDDEQRQ